MNKDIFKILIVEPDLEVGQLISSTLESEIAGDITLVQSSQQALSLCAQGSYDLIVTEQYLPNGSGPLTGSQLISYIRTHDKNNNAVPVLFFTVYTDEIFANSDLPKEDIYVLDKTSRMEKLITWTKILLYSQMKRKAKKQVQKEADFFQDVASPVLALAR